MDILRSCSLKDANDANDANVVNVAVKLHTLIEAVTAVTAAFLCLRPWELCATVSGCQPIQARPAKLCLESLEPPATHGSTGARHVRKRHLLCRLPVEILEILLPEHMPQRSLGPTNYLGLRGGCSRLKEEKGREI